MTNTNNPNGGADIVETLRAHRRIIGLLTIGLSLIVIVWAGATYWTQPRKAIVSLAFRPTFATAGEGQYPNQTPYAPTDIIAASVVDAVYDANGIATHCSRTAFANGFFIDQSSPEVDSLDAEYVGQLSDRSLNSSERQRLLGEYRLRRGAMELGYVLRWARPDSCATVSETIQRKIVSDVLLTWADQSQNQRGVLKIPVMTLSPEVLDGSEAGEVARLVRIDQVRLVLNAAVTSADDLLKEPGAELIRLSKGDAVSIADVRARITELLRTWLDPLLTEAGSGLGSDSVRWAEAALQNAEGQQAAADRRAESYALAIREFGQSSGARALGTPRDSGRQSAESGSAAVQVDRAFLDRMLELSRESVLFREQLTQQMVRESLLGVESSREVGYYRRLLQRLRNGGSLMTTADVDQRVAQIVTRGKLLIGQLRDLSAEFSRVAFRAAPNLYELDSPVRSLIDQPYAFRSFGLVLLLAPLAAFALVIAAVLFLTWAKMNLPRLR